MTQRKLAITLALMMGIAGCATAPSATPAPTSVWPTPLSTVAASVTVDPVVPDVEGPDIRDPGMGAVGVSNLTQAALPAEGQPDLDLPTTTPQPTAAQYPMPISGAGGLVMSGAYYAASVRPAPGALIVSRDRAAWEPLAADLQALGFAVLIIDLRGYGDTGGNPDWPRAQEDIDSALAQFVALPGIRSGQVAIIGEGIGANLALNACADDRGCGGAVLISAGLDYLGITTADAMPRFERRALLLVAGENDDNNPADSRSLADLARGPHQILVYPGGHGAELLVDQPDLTPAITAWLAMQFVPVTAGP